MVNNKINLYKKNRLHIKTYSYDSIKNPQHHVKQSVTDSKVPFTVPLSNSLTASLINLYKLKKVLHLAGLTDYSGVPIDNPSNNNPFQLPQGD